MKRLLLYYNITLLNSSECPKILNYFYNVNFHQLKHTGITRLIEVGTPVEIVQKKAGHKEVTTTMNIYNTVLSEREKEVNKNIEKQFEEKGLSLSIKDKTE